MNRRFAAAVSAAAVGAVTLTGCLGDPKPGPPGKVVAKDTDTSYIHHPGTGKHPGWTQTITSYYLTTKGKDGSVVRFEVTSGNYDHCYRGSAYPRCTKR